MNHYTKFIGILALVFFLHSCNKDTVVSGQIKFIKNEEQVWNGNLVAGDPKYY